MTKTFCIGGAARPAGASLRRADLHRALANTLVTAAVLSLTGCAAWAPPLDPPRDFLERVVTETSGGVSISAVVLSDAEAQAYFDAPLGKKDIQAIWLEVDNDTANDFAVNFLSVDADYFAPAEAAHMSRRFGERRTDEKAIYFYRQNVPLVIEGHSSASGFIFTNHDPGAKAFSVELFGDRASHVAEFAMMVPGFDADFTLTRPGEIYADEEIEDLSIDELRTWVEALPCCVLGGDRETPGDPLNIVFVAEGTRLLGTLVTRGWDLTETLALGTSWRTVVSSVFRSRYRTSPVSPLYLFDRPQDAAFQKARNTVDERNHMRIWRAPVNLNGVPVWVGQISRDIGVRFSGKTFVTHRIDSVVDEARTYLVLDMIEANRLSEFGYALGVGVSTIDDPRYNYTRDPYYTDGLRAVMIVSDAAVGFGEIVSLEWEPQPRESILERENP